MVQSQRVAQYISDDESNNDMELEPSINSGNARNRSKQNRRKWIPICTYNNKDDAINKIKNERTWSITHSNITSEGKRVYYRCNQVKRRGKQCPATIHVLYHIENECVTMYGTEDGHSYHESKPTGIDEKSKEVIDELFKMKIKPKRILEILEEKNLPVPKKQQLSNYLISLRVKLYGNSNISLGELEAWCQQKSIIPDDDDEPWVLKYEIVYGDEISDDDEEESDNENKFRFFVTTKRLLFNATISNAIHADATYKLVWEGFPCLIIGTTDMIKQFHPCGFAVCSNEEEKDFKFIFMSIRDGLQDLNMKMNEQNLALVADGTEAIRNAFSSVFGEDHNMIMCWSHMRKRVQKKLYLNKDLTAFDQIILDLFKKMEDNEGESHYAIIVNNEGNIPLVGCRDYHNAHPLQHSTTVAIDYLSSNSIYLRENLIEKFIEDIFQKVNYKYLLKLLELI